MDTKQIEVVLEAVKIGSIKKASEQLNYTQSGLIYLINVFEKAIGIPILERSYKGIKFNNAGKELEPYLLTIALADRALAEKVRDISNEQRRITQLRIGTYPSIAKFILPEIINKFLASRTNIDLEMIVCGADMPSYLAGGAIDFGIGEESLAGINHWQYFFETEIYAAIPKKYHIPETTSISMSELAEYPLIIPMYNVTDELLKRLERYPQIQRINVTTQDSAVLLSLVEQEVGISFMSKLNITKCPQSVRMIPIDPPIIRKMGFIIDQKKKTKPIIQEFVIFAQKNIENCKTEYKHGRSRGTE